LAPWSAARRLDVRWLMAVLALTLLASASARASESTEASTSDASRDEARRLIPMAKIDPEYRDTVRAVVGDPTLFRRMPTNVIDCRPQLYTFLVQNPEVLVELWRELGISKVQLTRIDEKTFRLEDGAGTTGKLVIVEQACDVNAQNRIVMYAQGTYDGKPFPRPVTAQCVLVLTSGSMDETNGRRYVASRLDSFVKLDRASLELVAKVLQPFVGQTADRNFADTLSFVSNLSYTAEKKPEAVAQLSTEMKNVDEPRRKELAKLAYECADFGRQWQAKRGPEAAKEATFQR
jgi:hypothetical protein